MIKVELEHNPYILETHVKFNGREPRINSQIEKYYNSKLNDWIKDVPIIFYEEMNGYNFELEFTGTDLDFELLSESFKNKKVTDEEVHLFLKNHIDSRIEKYKLINDLIEWLKNNPGRDFDYEKFMTENTYLSEEVYSVIFFDTDTEEYKGIDNVSFSVDRVADYEELAKTELRNIPIIISINKSNIEKVKDGLSDFISRKDVMINQLFFVIDNKINNGQTIRILQDLGIAQPQIVESVNDDLISKYIILNSFSDYLVKTIIKLREIISTIGKDVQNRKKESEITNLDIHNEIDLLENSIAKMKEVNKKFFNKDRLDIPEDWKNVGNIFSDTIKTWKNNKTKITKDEEACKLAYEYNEEIHKAYETFIENFNETEEATKQIILDQYALWYEDAECDNKAQISDEIVDTYELEPLPSFLEKFLELKDEQYVKPKEAFMDIIFGTTNSNSSEMIKETVYYYAKWRDFASSIVDPLIHEILESQIISMNKYMDIIADEYMDSIDNAIKSKEYKLLNATSKLSGEEKKILEDCSWLEEFEQKLISIERD